MNFYVVIHLDEGYPEDAWVTDKMDLAEEWKAELDARYGIERDEDGAPVPDEPAQHQVIVVNSYRQNIG